MGSSAGEFGGDLVLMDHDPGQELIEPHLHYLQHQITHGHDDIHDCGGLRGLLGFFHHAHVVCVGQDLIFCFLQLPKNADTCMQCVIWDNVKV